MKQANLSASPCRLRWPPVICCLIRAGCSALGGTRLFSCHSVTVFHTNTFEGKVPPAYPSVCAGPPGKDLSASRHLHTKKDLPHRNSTQRPLGCCGGLDELRDTVVTLTHTQRLHCFSAVLVLSDGEQRTTLAGEMLIQKKVSPNVSFIFQRWLTAAAASDMNKVYLETLLELNCKQI